ncbi:MAG: class I SAM-dependent methyltransferase, partial [Paracoccaceae bacterium]
MPSTLDGYFADNAYPAQLGERMTPGWIAAMATRNGWATPDLAKSFHMLDIGCGDGLGLALMAASHPHAVFEGMDGMEAHIDRGTVFARDIPNIHLARQLFSEALATGGAPCDFVTAHGILAWVAPRIRAEAMDLAATRLAPGGICAVSYNAMPG